MIAARRSGARGRAAILLASLFVLISIPSDLVPWLRGPAPYPPEWQWAFRPEGPARPLLAAAACALGLLGLLAASGTAWARERPADHPAGAHRGGGAPGRRPADRPAGAGAGATRSPSCSHAPARPRSPRTTRWPSPPRRVIPWLSSDLTRNCYPSCRGPPSTPPPTRPGRCSTTARPSGCARRFPRLTEGLLGAAGVPDTAFRPPATRAARAAALLGALLLVLLGAVTAWPVARLARALGVGILPAGRLAVLWSLLPGPALMTPQFDQALALLVAGATALLLAASGGAGFRWAAGAGILGGVAVLTSYGAVVFLLIGGLAAIASRGDRGIGLRRSLAVAGLASAAAGVVAIAIPALLGHEPLRALTAALSLHRELYTAPRSYLLWLAFNPLDLALFLGVPVAAGGLLALARSVRRRDAGAGTASLDRFRRVVFGGVAVVLVLGVTRGEVGRLWIPLMPLLLVASAGGPDAPGPERLAGRGCSPHRPHPRDRKLLDHLRVPSLSRAPARHGGAGRPAEVGAVDEDRISRRDPPARGPSAAPSGAGPRGRDTPPGGLWRSPPRGRPVGSFA